LPFCAAALLSSPFCLLLAVVVQIRADEGRLSEDDIERMVMEAERFAEEDNLAREAAKLARGVDCSFADAADRYAVLGLTHSATRDEIKAAYRALTGNACWFAVQLRHSSLRVFADSCGHVGGAGDLDVLSRAFETLFADESRAKYDAELDLVLHDEL
jgi:hypothetical protein